MVACQQIDGVDSIFVNLNICRVYGFGVIGIIIS